MVDRSILPLLANETQDDEAKQQPVVAIVECAKGCMNY